MVGKRDTLDDPVMQMVADRLSIKFSADEGGVTSEEVDDAVRESAESLEDAPVQTFVPVLAEHKARVRLRKLTKQRDPAN
jgi:hypothetical protein